MTPLLLYFPRNQENNRGAEAANTAVTVTRQVTKEAITMNEMNVETKELNEREMEKVIGGVFRPFGPVRIVPPERPDQDENKDGSGGATGGWEGIAHTTMKWRLSQ